MTDSFLKPYKLVVQTLCPVHIGSGDKLGNTDFVARGSQIFVIDDNKLTAWVLSQPNAERLALILADHLRGPGGIDKFLREQFRGRLDEITAYQLPFQGTPKDVAAFIKTIEHQPYLPGSSIKGSLRSALLRGVMLDDEDLQEKASEAILEGVEARGKPRTNSDRIQANVFSKPGTVASKWPNYDIYRLLVARDSYPMEQGSLEVVGVKTLSAQRSGRLQAKHYELSVEVFKPKLLIQHEITWQTHLLQDRARALGFDSLEHLMVFLPEYCRRASVNLLTQERDFYKRYSHRDLADWFEKKLALLSKNSDDVFILPIGWGSGYDAKTITDLLDSETFETVVDTFRNTWGLGKPGRRKDSEWLGPDDSPKSRRVVERLDGTFEPMGWAACRFTPEGDETWMAERQDALAERRPTAILINIGEREATGLERPSPEPERVTPPPPDVPRRPLTPTFTELPKIGERFEGKVWVEEKPMVYVEIPGLSADDYAVAVYQRDRFDTTKLNEGDRVVCTVIQVVEDPHQPGHWLVRCERE